MSRLIIDEEIKKSFHRAFYLTPWPLLHEREYFNDKDEDVRLRSRGFTSWKRWSDSLSSFVKNPIFFAGFLIRAVRISSLCFAFFPIHPSLHPSLHLWPISSHGGSPPVIRPTSEEKALQHTQVLSWVIFPPLLRCKQKSGVLMMEMRGGGERSRGLRNQRHLRWLLMSSCPSVNLRASFRAQHESRQSRTPQIHT